MPADNEVARSLYDRHGFEVHEERTVVLGGRKADDVVLVRELCGHRRPTLAPDRAGARRTPF